MVQDKKCFLCGKLGHLIRNCPNKNEDITRNPQAHTISTHTPTIIDSGATQHMFKNLADFGTAYPQHTQIICANSQNIPAIYVGTVTLNIGDDDTPRTLHEVLHVPELKNNLISVRALTKEGNKVVFNTEGTVEMTSDDGRTHQIGEIKDDLY